MRTVPITFLGGTNYASEALALFARMNVQPIATRKELINNFITGIKVDSGISILANAFDCIWFTAAHDQQASRLNWVKNAHDLTEVNSPTWTLDRGYNGNGISQYLDTNYNLLTQGVNYTQNNAALHLYNRSAIDGSNYDMGSYETATTTRNTLHFTGLTQRWGGINTLVASGFEVGDIIRLSTWGRTTNNICYLYKDGVLLDNYSDTSVVRTSLNIYICCLNFDNTPSLFTSRQYAFAAASRGNINILSLYNRVQTYLTALGAQV